MFFFGLGIVTGYGLFRFYEPLKIWLKKREKEIEEKLRND